ncbi:MAG: sugar phosphate isomerase/epimerase [Saprospiraceae bacterium]|nr:sugar phosphate isomerase/epimerase [Saprospiraceae bacterium]
MGLPLLDTSRLCIHTITHKPWSLEVALDHFAKNSIAGISVWQSAIEEIGAVQAGELLASYPIDVVSYVRGGFFAHPDPKKRVQAIRDNRIMLEEAAALHAPLLVLVCGAHPAQSLSESRDQIQEGIEALLPDAQKYGIKLGIEPLHPMYADSRSAISTLRQALDMSLTIESPMVGVVIDVYHLWWDDQLAFEIKRCGIENRIFAFHICDWKSPTTDILLDRGLMGEGCIEIKRIRNMVEDAGFLGYIEVEIFSNIYWQMDQEEFLQRIIAAYLQQS